jgi:hypothetical protein
MNEFFQEGIDERDESVHWACVSMHLNQVGLELGTLLVFSKYASSQKNAKGATILDAKYVLDIYVTISFMTINLLYIKVEGGEANEFAQLQRELVSLQRKTERQQRELVSRTKWPMMWVGKLTNLYYVMRLERETGREPEPMMRVGKLMNLNCVMRLQRKTGRQLPMTSR